MRHAFDELHIIIGNAIIILPLIIIRSELNSVGCRA